MRKYERHKECKEEAHFVGVLINQKKERGRAGVDTVEANVFVFSKGGQ